MTVMTADMTPTLEFTPRPLTRQRTWPEQLDALVQSCRNRHFEWGHHDCCTFAADAVLAITGTDVMAALRGQYHSRRQADRLLSDLGGLTAAVTAMLGQPARPALVTVGDILLIDNAGRELLAVCNGATALAPGPAGLLTVSAPAVLAAWRVA